MDSDGHSHGEEGGSGAGGVKLDDGAWQILVPLPGLICLPGPMQTHFLAPGPAGVYSSAVSVPG